MSRTQGVEPSSHPDTEFELWSVPSFPAGMPEIVRGRAVGSNKQRVVEGDVLLCKINPRINRVWRVGPDSGRPQVASTEWIVFRSQVFDPAFLMWRFREGAFREALCRTVAGVGGSLTRARPQEVAKIEIALPPLAEQRRIVARLEALEARCRRARAALNEVPALLAQARQSLLAAAFRGELTQLCRDSPTSGAAGRLPVDRALDTVPPSWGWAELGELASVTGGLTKSPRRVKYGLKRPYLRVANVYANHLDLTEVAEMGVASEEVEKVLLRKDDLLVVEGNGSPGQIGRVALWDGSIVGCLHQNHIIKVRCTGSVLPQILLFWLLSPGGRDCIGRMAKSSSGLYTLSVSKVASLPVPIPRPAEQREIVCRLERGLARLDAAAAAHATAVAELERLEQSLLDRAFRGQLVPRDPGERRPRVAA